MIATMLACGKCKWCGPRDDLRNMGDFRTLRVAFLIAVVFAGTALPWVSGTVTAAPTCHAASGPRTLPLVELFTSEGCDSCPPADRWLSAQFPPRQSGSDPTAVALAFHVDYWDRLGWRDRFASAQFTQRQYAEMTANRAAFVYTPQVLVQGHDVPGWNRGQVPAEILAASNHSPRAKIELDVVSETDALQLRATATVEEVTQRKNARLWLVSVDSGHVTDVAAGENRGVRLHHDNVVRVLAGPYAFDAHGMANVALRLTPSAERGSAQAIVAFVQDDKTGDVAQTVWLPVASCAVAQ